METASADARRKVVVYGAPHCGKTSLLRRWADNEWSASEAPTLAMNVIIRGSSEVWDTSGEERFRDVVLAYLGGAHAVMFVYNIANRDSYNALVRTWIPTVLGRKAQGQHLDLYLVGSHLDLEDGPPSGGGLREVAIDEAVALAARWDMHYGECSAKTGQSMDHLRLWLEHPTGNEVALGAQQQQEALVTLEPFAAKKKGGRTRGCCCGRKYVQLDEEVQLE